MPKSTHSLTALQQDERGLERLIFFSDAVFAIAITLLALTIQLPAGTPVGGDVPDSVLAAALAEAGKKIFSYVISFLIIGIYWISHHRLFRRVQRYDSRLMLINLVLLMSIGFIPFPTSLVSEYGNRTAVVFYASSVAVVGLLTALMWMYITYHGRLLDAPLERHEWLVTLARLLVAPVVFLVSIGLAFINTELAKYAWALSALGALIR
jgi:uncharacterized membrane protein